MLLQLLKQLSQPSRLFLKKTDYLWSPDHCCEKFNQKPGGVEVQKDPVCGMMVDEKKTKLTSKHGTRHSTSAQHPVRPRSTRTLTDTDTNSRPLGNRTERNPIRQY